MSRNDANLVLEKCLDYVLALLVFLGVATSVVAYAYNRSLWINEAMLAQSVLTRSITRLLATPLDYAQSAPAGYLLVVKLLTMLFGRGEWVLRSISMVSSFASVLLVYLLLRQYFRVSKPLIGTALLATLPFFVQYSNEFKPYMTDACLALLVVYCYVLYTQKRMSLVGLTVLYSLTIWFSFAAIFIALPVIGYQAATAGRDRRAKYAASMACILISAAIYYLVWLKPSASGLRTDETEYWRHLSFPLLPKSIGDLRLIKRMARHLLEVLGQGRLIYLLLAASGLVTCFRRHKEFFWILLATAGLILIASYLGKYPIQDRLLLFLYPLLMLLVAVSLDAIRRYDARAVPVILIVLAFLFWSNSPFLKSMIRRNVYMPGSQTSGLIGYLEANVRNTNNIYLFAQAIPVFDYKNNYVTGLSYFPTSVVEKRDIICGTKYWDMIYWPYACSQTINERELANNIRAITSHQSVYILFSHMESDTDPKILRLIGGLSSRGRVRLVREEYNTCLYHYQAR